MRRTSRVGGQLPGLVRRRDSIAGEVAAGEPADGFNQGLDGAVMKGGWPGYRVFEISSSTNDGSINDGCPTCLAFGHLGDSEPQPAFEMSRSATLPSHPPLRLFNHP